MGGHCEQGEPPNQRLQRELVEEIGIRPKECSLLRILKEPHAHSDFEFYVYLVTKSRGTLMNKHPDEHAEIQWFALHEARRLELAHPKYYDLIEEIDDCPSI